jgi:glutathione-regulated potassium-efflux system ancillary protein KefF
MIDLVYAHPYPNRSRANRHLLEAVRDLPDLEVRSLYDLYPEFSIDVEAEQAALQRARIVIWMHPLYWYSVPPLLKLWFDKVLAYGWAYGDDSYALRDKLCLWVTTTGGDAFAFSPQGNHQRPFADFVPVIEQTARFCQMRWATPFVLHGSHKIDEPALHANGDKLRAQLKALIAREQETARHG